MAPKAVDPPARVEGSNISDRGGGGQSATVVLIYGSRTSGVKGARNHERGGWRTHSPQQPLTPFVYASKCLQPTTRFTTCPGT